ncbi:MAG: GNAT family N-acetyltransferase [Aggregatilineales bacterium]
MPIINIVSATPADSARLYAIITRAFAQYKEMLVPPSSVFKETADSIQTKLTKGGGFIVRIKDQDAGSVLYEPQEDHLYLGRLAVLPEYRGKGIAHALINAVESHASQHNFPRVKLGVRLALEANRRLFTSLGYEIIDYGTHDGFPEPTYVNMAKSITSKQ